jgi:transposase
MKHYPQELKDRLTARMLAPHNESVAALAHETQIPKDTLYGWRTAALGRVNPVPAPGAATALSSDDKFGVVLESARLNEHELGEYCRAKGLFVQQVQTWRERCTAANATGPSRAEQGQMREQAREIRQLRSALQRKDQALAEAAALLLLQKKVRALWGEDAAPASTSRSANQ